MYFGIVENILDPVNCGRVQVRVLPHYRDFSVDDLPWAYVLRSTDLGNTNGKGLNMHGLIEGSQVLVDYLDEYMQQPIVLGIVPGESDFDNMQSYVKHELKFLNGSEIIVDETPLQEYIKVIDNNQNYIMMDAKGITIHCGALSNNIVIESEGDVKITSTSDTSIESKGSTSINATGNAEIVAGGNISVEAGGNAEVKASGNGTIEASKLSLKNITGAAGQLCSLPACLFTGAKHQSPTSD